MAGEGLQQIDSLRKAGFPEPEIVQWRADTHSQLSKAGFSSKEIGVYFGKRAPNMAPVKTLLIQNIAPLLTKEIAHVMAVRPG